MKILSKITLFFVLLFSAAGVFGQQTEREKGFEFYNQGDYAKAVESWRKAAEAKDEDRELWLFIGMALVKSGEKKDGIKAFEKAANFAVKRTAENYIEAKVISRQKVSYTDQARISNVQGDVKLAVELLADGKVGMVYAFQTLPYGLTENAVAAARKMKFEPATKDGKPVTSIRIMANHFSLYLRI